MIDSILLIVDIFWSLRDGLKTVPTLSYTIQIHGGMTIIRMEQWWEETGITAEIKFMPQQKSGGNIALKSEPVQVPAQWIPKECRLVFQARQRLLTGNWSRENFAACPLFFRYLFEKFPYAKTSEDIFNLLPMNVLEIDLKK